MHMHTYIYIPIHKDKYINAHIYIYVCIHTYMYIYIPIYIYICICIHIHIHIHTYISDACVGKRRPGSFAVGARRLLQNGPAKAGITDTVASINRRQHTVESISPVP